MTRPRADDALASYRQRLGYFDKRQHRIRARKFKELTRNALPLYLRGGDIISRQPMANGVYERDIKHLFEHCAANGYGDFLIDIGANIGLSSCQSGTHFKIVHMYEPNPDCLHILTVNTKIALKNHPYVIHDYGLGVRTETLSLYVPYNNWGGAFIRSPENEYDDAVLSDKDGFQEFSAENYNIMSVKVAAATEELSRLFAELAAAGHRQGVIKIDVEGYESVVIEAIAATLPAHMSVRVVFENWQPGTEMPGLAKGKARGGTISQLYHDKQPWASGPKWFNTWLTFLRGGYDVVIRPVEGALSAGTFILSLPLGVHQSPD